MHSGIYQLFVLALSLTGALAPEPDILGHAFVGHARGMGWGVGSVEILGDIAHHLPAWITVASASLAIAGQAHAAFPAANPGSHAGGAAKTPAGKKKKGSAPPAPSIAARSTARDASSSPESLPEPPSLDNGLRSDPKPPSPSIVVRLPMPAQYFPGEVSSDFYGSRPPLPTPTAPNVPDYLAHARDGDAGSPPATKPLVTIHPPFLTWNDTPLCSPATSTLEIKNTSDDLELLIYSLSTDDLQFYPSNVMYTSIAPGDHASISIVFLPRAAQEVDATMVVQTSMGAFLIQLHGQGVPSPYQVEPVASTMVPVGVAYERSLTLHNPFDELLKVKEVFTNEDFFRLSLPRVHDPVAEDAAAAPQDPSALTPNATQSPAALWEIGPLETKTVIHLEFASGSPGKHVGMVHVVTSRETLMVPVEIQAVKGGLFRTPDELDFGTLTHPDENATLPIMLFNSRTSPVTMLDVLPVSLDPSLQIHARRGLVVPPNTELEVARVTYYALQQGWVTSKLLMWTNDAKLNSHLEVATRARVVYGSFGYNESDVLFEDGPSDKPHVRSLRLTNNFAVPIVIFAAKIPDPKFKLLNFSGGFIVRPGEASPAIRIQYSGNGSRATYAAPLTVSTNASKLRVPLQVYHGRLRCTLQELAPRAPEVPAKHFVNLHNKAGVPKTAATKEGRDRRADVPPAAEAGASGLPVTVDFGVVGVGEERTQAINVTNLNPVAVSVLSVRSTLAAVTLSLQAVHAASGGRLPLPSSAREAPYPDDPPARRTKRKKGGGGAASSSSSSPSRSNDTDKGAGMPTLFPAGAERGAAEARSVGEGGVYLGRNGEGPEGGALVTLAPGASAVFQVRLLASEEGVAAGAVEVATRFEALRVAVAFESIKGTLQVSPSLIRFKPAFPGKVLRKAMWAWSTYQRPLHIQSVASTDARMIPEMTETVVPPNKRVKIGYLVWDTSKVALEEHYLSDATFAGSAGLSAMAAGFTRLDVQALKRREVVWNNILNRGLSDVRATLVVHTDVVRGVAVTAQGSLERPTILPDNHMQFPLSQMNVPVSQEFRVHNPSDHPLSLRLLPLPLDDGSMEGALAIGTFKGADWAARVEAFGRGKEFSLGPGAGEVVVVPPHSEALVGPVVFKPSAQREHTALLLLKNNLTLLQALPIVGHGGTGLISYETLGGQPTSLSFPLSAGLLGLKEVRATAESHNASGAAGLARWLTGAARGARAVVPAEPVRREGELLRRTGWPTVVSRTFNIVNRGNLPINVTSLAVGSPSGGCAAYGFTLRNCHAGGFNLAPGQKTRLEVTFRPDFAASRVRRHLFLATTSGLLASHMDASVPAHLLPACLDRVPMTPQEQSTRTVCTACLVLVAMGLVVLTAKEVVLDGAAKHGTPGAGAPTSTGEPQPSALSSSPRSKSPVDAAPKREAKVAAAPAASSAARCEKEKEKVKDKEKDARDAALPVPEKPEKNKKKKKKSGNTEPAHQPPSAQPAECAASKTAAGSAAAQSSGPAPATSIPAPSGQPQNIRQAAAASSSSDVVQAPKQSASHPSAAQPPIAPTLSPSPAIPPAAGHTYASPSPATSDAASKASARAPASTAVAAKPPVAATPRPAHASKPHPGSAPHTQPESAKPVQPAQPLKKVGSKKAAHSAHPAPSRSSAAPPAPDVDAASKSAVTSARAHAGSSESQQGVPAAPNVRARISQLTPTQPIPGHDHGKSSAASSTRRVGNKTNNSNVDMKSNAIVNNKSSVHNNNAPSKNNTSMQASRPDKNKDADNASGRSVGDISQHGNRGVVSNSGGLSAPADNKPPSAPNHVPTQSTHHVTGTAVTKNAATLGPAQPPNKPAHPLNRKNPPPGMGGFYNGGIGADWAGVSPNVVTHGMETVPIVSQAPPNPHNPMMQKMAHQLSARMDGGHDPSGRALNAARHPLPPGPVLKSHFSQGPATAGAAAAASHREGFAIGPNSAIGGHGNPALVSGSAMGPERLPLTNLGLHDSLSSIGLARLDAEGELGSVVYNIWGEQQMGPMAAAQAAAKLRSGTHNGPDKHPVPRHAFAWEEDSRKTGEQRSFFSFPSSMAGSMEPLEPEGELEAEGSPKAFRSTMMGQLGNVPGGFNSGFSMFSNRSTGEQQPYLPSLDRTWGAAAASDMDSQTAFEQWSYGNHPRKHIE